MVDSAWRWATANKKIRRNVVHGKEEARLVLDDWFDNKKETGQNTTMTGTGELEDMAIPKYRFNC